MTPREIMVSMRDDVRLQSFVHLPEGKGSFPSLMVRCMYGTDAVLGKTERFVQEGYAVVAQNVRGRRKSEGGETGRGDFREDGFDTIEWMVTQSWCSGRGSTKLHQIPMWFFYAQRRPELNPYDQIDWISHLAKLPTTSILDDLGGPLDLFRDVVAESHENYMNFPTKGPGRWNAQWIPSSICIARGTSGACGSAVAFPPCRQRMRPRTGLPTILQIPCPPGGRQLRSGQGAAQAARST